MTSPRTALPLVAAVALVTLELIRSSGPLIDMAFTQGVVTAAGTALGAYAMPGVLAAGLVAVVVAVPSSGARHGEAAHGRVARLARAAVAGALLLAVLRAVLPFLAAGLRFGVGLVAVALAIGVLTLAVRTAQVRHGATAAVRALVLGLVTHVGLQLALGTWDAVWRTDAAGWAVTVLMVLALVTAAVLALPAGQPPAAHASAEQPSTEQPSRAGAARLWALGPFLAIATMMVANPAFAASQSGVPLLVAGPVLAAALLVGTWLAGPAHPAGGGRGGTVALLALLVVATAGAVLTGGTGALVSLAVLAAVAPRVLALALTGRASRRAGATPGVRPWRTAAAATAVGLGTILPLLVYQLDYDVPLGFPNGLVLVGAGLALALAATGTTAASVPEPARGPGLTPLAATAVGAVVVGAVLLAVPTVAAQRASAAGADPRADSPTATVVSWNLHYGVTPAGHVALEDVARAIEATDACVVLLQEVSRGWVLGGGADMATWLANRLGMRVSFAPAADRQFGNAVLSCAPHDDVVVHELPYGAGPQQRSAISATVALAEPQRYTSVHLQHRESSTPTRLDQLATLLGGADAADLGVLGGDLNAEPGWPEIDAVLAAGYTSAQDAVGDPAQLTSPTTDLRHRIDWVFTPEDVEPLTLEHLVDEQWSDHLALVLTHRVGG